jgi:hypothetical protein
MRAYLLGQKRDRERADQHLRDVIGEVLPHGLLRALLGPGLIVLGIVIGTIANIAASS